MDLRPLQVSAHHLLSSDGGLLQIPLSKKLGCWKGEEGFLSGGSAALEFLPQGGPFGRSSVIFLKTELFEQAFTP